jgi:hypothetical protein
MNRCQWLRARGYSIDRIMRETHRSRTWVNEQLAEKDSGVWEIDRSKPLPEALLDRLQAGHVRQDDPETLEVVAEIVELARSADAELSHSLERIAHHIADGATPSTDPLIGIHLRLARSLRKDGACEVPTLRRRSARVARDPLVRAGL